MDWRAWKLLNASERAWLVRGMRGNVADWSAAWLPSAEPGALRCVDAGERAATRLAAEPRRWLLCAHHEPSSTEHGTSSIAIALDEDLERGLADALLSVGVRSALAGDVTAAALRDLGKRLLGGRLAAQASITEQAPGADCWRRGSGAALFEIEAGRNVVAVLASPRWVAGQLSARPRAAQPARRKPADPRQCMAHARVSLQAWAGSAVLEIGLLQTLAPGDVILLESRIDQGLRISVQGRETGQRGWIGRIEDRRAVRLAASR